MKLKKMIVEEQVNSLGAKFVKIDLGETGQTEQGGGSGPGTRRSRPWCAFKT